MTAHIPGLHLLLDLTGARNLADAAALERALRGAAHAGGATILSSEFRSFGAGQGVTGVVLLAESHISVHTWPELDFAAVDIFMCGRADARRAAAHLQRELAPTDSTITEVPRYQRNQASQPSR